MESKLTEMLNQQLENVLQFLPCAGVSASIIDSKLGDWNGCAGYRDLDKRDPLSTNDRFYIYSITKTFLATYILKLEENNILNIQDPIIKWLPELPYPKTITIKHLLGHSSGLKCYTEYHECHHAVIETPHKSWNWSDYFSLPKIDQLKFNPGSQVAYSNFGYMILKRMIEVAAKKSISQVLQEEILAPLNLFNTTLVQSFKDTKFLTPGYGFGLNKTNSLQDVRQIYDPGWVAHGLLSSTAYETAAFFHSLFANNLLTEESLQKMTELHPIQPFIGLGKPSYGLGLVGDPEFPQGLYYGHTGGGPGFTAIAAHFPKFNGRPISVSLLCNSGMYVNAFPIASQLLKVLEK